MKKLKFLLVLTILIPINAKALSGSISANCTPSSATPGSTVTCSINGNSDDTVTSLEVPFTISSGASVDLFEYDTSIWGYNGEDNNKIEAVPKETLTGNFNIGTLKIKIADNASGTISLNLNNVIFYDKNDSEVNIAGTSANITVTSETPTVVSGLKTLECTNGGTLSPQLSDSNYGYALVLNSPSISQFSLSATAKNNSDTISFVNGDTNETLNPSNITFKTSGGKDTMLVKINVGSDKVYTITVSKPVSEKGGLGSLIIGGRSVTLVNGKYDYEVSLDNVDSYQIQATATDSSKFKLESSNLSRTLSGANSYEIIVKPIDDTSGYESTIYIVTVKKSGASTPTKAPEPQTPTPTRNPETGEGGLFIMAIVLFASLGASLYLYKRNMSTYTD